MKSVASNAAARDRFPNTPWLLPGSRANPDGHKHVDHGQIRRDLARWVADCDIRDQAGDPIDLKPHRFRHTIATELLNRGMTKAAIKRFLSHKSEEMTNVYAHIARPDADGPMARDEGPHQQRRRTRRAADPRDHRRSGMAQARARAR